MYSSSFRLALGLTICLSLVFSNPWLWVGGFVVQGQGQRSKREGRPKPGKPEGVFPDLEDVQRVYSNAEFSDEAIESYGEG